MLQHQRFHNEGISREQGAPSSPAFQARVLQFHLDSKIFLGRRIGKRVPDGFKSLAPPIFFLILNAESGYEMEVVDLVGDDG
jgi:hypothetical protein